MTDPAETRQAILESDPRRDELVDVLHLWHAALGVAAVEVAEIPKRLPETAALHDKLVEVACRGVWNGQSVGWWLRRNRERVVSGLCLRCQQDGGRNGQRWFVAVDSVTAVELPYEA